MAALKLSGWISEGSGGFYISLLDSEGDWGSRLCKPQRNVQRWSGRLLVCVVWYFQRSFSGRNHRVLRQENALLPHINTQTRSGEKGIHNFTRTRHNNSTDADIVGTDLKTAFFNPQTASWGSSEVSPQMVSSRPTRHFMHTTARTDIIRVIHGTITL